MLASIKKKGGILTHPPWKKLKQKFQDFFCLKLFAQNNELNGARHDYVIKTREYLQGLLDN